MIKPQNSLVWFFLSFLLCSCIKEEVKTMSSTGQEAILEVGIATKSSSTKESGIKDFFLFVLDADTENITHKYYFDKGGSNTGDATSTNNNSNAGDTTTTSDVYCDIDLSSNGFAHWNVATSTLSHIKTFDGNIQLIMIASKSSVSVRSMLPSLEKCTSISDLENLVFESKGLPTAQNEILSGYCYVDGNNSFKVQSGVNQINGSIKLYSAHSKNLVSISSKENRFTMTSYKLVDLASKSYALSSSTKGWKELASNPLPLQSTEKLYSFTKSTDALGQVCFSFSFDALERKGMKELASHAKETIGINSLLGRYNYAKDVLSKGLSELRASYMEIQGVYREVDDIIYGLRIYIPLGDISNAAGRTDWTEMDVLRGKRYLYNIRINGINDIETTLADFPFIEYFTLKADDVQSFNISPLPIGMEYKVGEEFWETLTEEALTNGIYFGGSKGDLCLRGRGGKGTGESTISFGEPNVKVSCSGDLRSLVDYYELGTTSTVNLNQARFANLFLNNTQLSDVSGIVFPENTGKLSVKGAYEQMFAGCTELINAPDELPAIHAGDYYYYKMFKGCSKLLNAPTIRLEDLSIYCCSEMFQGCSSLTKVQDDWNIKTIQTAALQRCFAECTSLVSALRNVSFDNAASDMFLDGLFQNCSSLTEVFPSLPAPLLRAHTYNKMFMNCTSLEKAPSIKAKYHRDPRNVNSMRNMFSGCINLQTPPDTLHMIEPQNGCYAEMFSGCVKLNKTPVIMAMGVPASIEILDVGAHTTTFVDQAGANTPNYAFYRIFQNCPISQIEILNPKVDIKATTDYRMFDTDSHWPNEHWYSKYQDFNLTPFRTNWPSSGIILVATQEAKDALDASTGLVPKGWVVKVKE